MGRSERHDLFERMIALRDAYPGSDDDRTGVLSIADAVRYGEAVMTAVELDVEPWVADPDDAAADEASADAVGGPSPAPMTRTQRFASDLWPWPRPSTLWSRIEHGDIGAG